MKDNLIYNPDLNSFCSFIKRNNLNKGARLCGVDLKGAYTNFKLYIELLQIPSNKLVLEFLGPTLGTHFFDWCRYWDDTRKSGLAFGIKVDTNNACKKYFHIKFKKTFDQVLFSSRFAFLRLLKIDINQLFKGISYEITSDKEFTEKFYLYIKDPLSIKKVLCYKQMLYNLDVNEIEELELYGTADSFKINIINQLDNFKVKQDIWQTIPSDLNPQLKEWSSMLNCDPIYTGTTSTGVTSAYFSFTTKRDNILNI